LGGDDDDARSYAEEGSGTLGLEDTAGLEGLGSGREALFCEVSSSETDD
jgi:hypothetical protein